MPYRKTITQRDGTEKRSMWYLRFRDHNGAILRPAGSTDKRLAELIERNLKRLVEFRKAGAPPDERLQDWLSRLTTHWTDYIREHDLVDSAMLTMHLDKLLDRYIVYKQDRDHEPRAIVEARARIERLLTGIDAYTLRDVTPEKVRRWLADQRKADVVSRDEDERIRFSARTSNHYLQSVKAWLNWLVREEFISSNPIARVQKIRESTDRRLVRRAFTPAEFKRLLETTEAQPTHFNHNLTGVDRAMLYRLAACTGFRLNQIRQLTPVSFDLSGKPPTVTAKAKTVKSRKEQTNPLPPAIARMLKTYLNGADRGEPVFDLPLDCGKILKRDMLAAGIEAEDETGRKLDFHALRKTLATNLVAGGVHPKVAQRLLGHSTIAMTMDVYADANMDDVAKAVRQLP